MKQKGKFGYINVKTLGVQKQNKRKTFKRRNTIAKKFKDEWLLGDNI